MKMNDRVLYFRFLSKATLLNLTQDQLAGVAVALAEVIGLRREAGIDDDMTIAEAEAVGYFDRDEVDEALGWGTGEERSRLARSFLAGTE